jgi:hypothetical protein
VIETKKRVANFPLNCSSSSSSADEIQQRERVWFSWLDRLSRLLYSLLGQQQQQIYEYAEENVIITKILRSSL